MRKDRIEQRLADLGMNQFQVAVGMGRRRTYLNDFLTGRKSEFKGSGPVDLAIALGCSLEYLTGESDDIGVPPTSTKPFDPSRGRLLYGGQIEEGTRRRHGVSLAKLPYSVSAIDGVPREHQIVFIVAQESFEESLVIKAGSAVKCVRPEHAGPALRTGAWVVLRTVVDGMAELVMREVRQFPDRMELLSLDTGEVVEVVGPDGRNDDSEIVGVARAVEFPCP